MTTEAQANRGTESQTLTQKEAARRLGISIRTLQRFVRQGRLTPTYQAGKTRSVPVFDPEEVEALRITLLSRPAYPQTKTSTQRVRKQSFGFRIDPAELKRLSEEASRHSLSVSEYVRTLIQIGLEGELQQQVIAMNAEIASLKQQIAELEESQRQAQREFTETVEVLLEVGGMSAAEARRWVSRNLGAR